ncbi:hypothetical protein BC939DRAFT_466749 [Gamsiella multidivaricata]|uniref:uncharacterized protein n=1 Tax=Gamsiella multidivaricata TaxID=101098 RepID=UPI002220E790|nr:uncharacterized protein BC939DRAFT_466749 [Gamsiella multidivaricata]KAG0370142.1 chitin deacetylase [Gamsiella multidivaricata]KAI7817188.1 hypothetical protein BC939DRAFT_466749 [Gamsiella multidivaricata]
MLAKQLSLASIMVALASAATAPAPTPSSTPIPAPLIPLPPFNGTFAGSYPPTFAIAATSSPQVAKWMSELNLTAVPDIPVVKVTSGGTIVSPNSIPASACDWSVDNCINKDITTCPVGVWGLSYDDGPTEFSPQLYDFLDKTNQKATLFYIGSNVLTNWQSARRACGAGHQIAVHTWSHHYSTSLTNEQFVAEVKYTEMAIKELCGVTPTYFRPPYGDIDNRIRGLLTQMGYTSVIWDLDTNDWEMAPGGKLSMQSVNSAFDAWIAKAPQDTTGHVCLEHELYQNTVNAAITNLPKLQKTWKTMPVAACVNDPHPYREKNITLATLNGAKTGVNNASNTTVGNSAVSPGASATPTGTAKTGGSTPARALTSVTVAVAAAVICAGQMLL